MNRALHVAWLVMVACGKVNAPQMTVDAAVDSAARDAASATVTLQLPKYLDLGSSASWQATVHGPALASVQYAWQVTPLGAATFGPASASSALDATGAATLAGTVVGGGSATTANAQLMISGGAEGAATGAITVATFETFGYRAPFTQSVDTTLTAGRVLAFPFAMTAGQRVIGLGVRTGTAANVQVGIYGTSGAAPADLLVASPVIAATPGETLVYLDTPQTPAAQPSYLALVAASDLSIAVDSNSADGVTEFAADITVGGPLPSPFVQTTSFTGGPTNVFVIAIAP